MRYSWVFDACEALRGAPNQLTNQPEDNGLVLEKQRGRGDCVGKETPRLESAEPRGVREVAEGFH